MIRKLAPLVFACAAVTSVNATADQLDTVIQRGTLNCGVVLDFPPMGYFDENNNPAGFDVDYCNELGGAPGVDVNGFKLTRGERVPSLGSGQNDVGIGFTPHTPQSAKTVGFPYPHFLFKFPVNLHQHPHLSIF